MREAQSPTTVPAEAAPRRLFGGPPGPGPATAPCTADALETIGRLLDDYGARLEESLAAARGSERAGVEEKLYDLRLTTGALAEGRLLGGEPANEDDGEDPLSGIEGTGAFAYEVYEAARPRFGKDRQGRDRFSARGGRPEADGGYALRIALDGVGEVEIRALPVGPAGGGAAAPPSEGGLMARADGVGATAAEHGAYLREGIKEARLQNYRSQLSGDRYDGTPNFDTRTGEEAALRAFAARFGIDVPGEDETREAALRSLEEANPESDIVQSFAETLRSGGEWEYKG